MQKEKCQVIYFPLKFIPSDEILYELEHLRGQFKYVIQQINCEERENPYQRELRKLIFHNKVRDNFKLLKGGID